MDDLYVGVDLGGTNLRCAVVRRNHEIVQRFECPTKAVEGPNHVIDRIIDGINRALEKSGCGAADIKAAGIGIPGPINQEEGLVYSAPNLPGWNNVPLAGIIQNRVGIAAFVENDANCAGWGEYAVGAGRGCRHMLMVTLGTGIGGAVIIDGKLHIGRDGTAGELGHVCIEHGGRLCGCGARGCVEAYASAPSVVRRFWDLVNAGWESPLAKSSAAVTCQDVFSAAGAGDAVALYVVKKTGEYLGVMIASMAELLNPEICVIAGGMILAGETFFSAIRETCLNWNGHPSRTLSILPAELGANAGLVGAADHARVRTGG
jgi:glucokinase